MKNQNILKPLKYINFANFLQYQRFVMPISFLFYLHNGLNFSDFILFQSIFNITCLIVKLPLGYLGDIFSKKFLLIFSYFLFMLRVILWIFLEGFWIILAGEILYGFSKALYKGNIDSYMYEYLQKNNISNQMISRFGKLSFWTSIGSAVSCFAGVIIYKYTNFRILLIIELIMQIIAVTLLFFIPNIQCNKTTKKENKKYLSVIYSSIKQLVTDKKININVYYTAMFTGLISVFVWNFQPLLKLCYAPVIIFGFVSFINQSLRGVGGLLAKKITNIFGNKIIYIEYFFVLISFYLLIYSTRMQNYIIATCSIIIICIAIMFFFIYSIYTTSKIHKYIEDSNRATVASSNVFLSDFASFAFLLLLKFTYDLYGQINTLLIFMCIFGIILCPLFFRQKIK